MYVELFFVKAAPKIIASISSNFKQDGRGNSREDKRSFHALTFNKQGGGGMRKTIAARPVEKNREGMI